MRGASGMHRDGEDAELGLEQGVAAACADEEPPRLLEFDLRRAGPARGCEMGTSASDRSDDATGMTQFCVQGW